jgi:hypothetical protein
MKSWRTERFCLLEFVLARFVVRAKTVHDVDEGSYDEAHSLSCTEGGARHVLGGVRETLPM